MTSGRHALVVGEALVDIVHESDGSSQEHPGGSAANVALALARLGRPVQLATSLGHDERGGRIRDHLTGDGVVLIGDVEVLDHTSTASATIDEEGAATYDFDLDWRLGDQSEVEQPVAVHVCSIAAVLEPGATDVVGLIERLREGATITYDVNARPAITGTGADVVAAVEKVVALSDLVKASDEDLATFYPHLSLAEAAEHLRSLGPVGVVVTRGGAGSHWYAEAGLVVGESVRVEVADTIGAGDTFGAALIDALWERDLLGGRPGDLDDDDRAAILNQAARVAAVTVSRPGADPPYRRELDLPPSG